VPQPPGGQQPRGSGQTGAFNPLQNAPYNSPNAPYNPPQAGYNLQAPYNSPANPYAAPRAAPSPGLKPEKMRRAPAPFLSMFLGVYTFPFTNGDALLRLVGTSICFSFSFAMLVLALDQAPQVGAMALRPVGQAFFMSFILTMGYAVAQSAAIVQDTAEGLEEVYNWPSFEWRDWALAYFFVAFVGAAAAAVGYGVYAAAGFRYWWLVPLVMFWVFPVMLMSALEGESPFMLLTLPVLKSLGRAWWAWGMFYLQTGVWLVGWMIAAATGLFTMPYVSIPITASLWALLVLLYARLMGRLAWCISQSEPEIEEE
jgi:hypothetical protein